ncbi:MAG: CRTAC1 family protein, partial [Candidatus Zixiibacteriota bacterium]
LLKNLELDTQRQHQSPQCHSHQSNVGRNPCGFDKKGRCQKHGTFDLLRFLKEGGNPAKTISYWMSVFTGMTTSTRLLAMITLCMSLTAVAGGVSFALDPPVTSEIIFTDVTVAAGIDFVETIGDDKMSNIVESSGVGCAFFDYDNDGWMDIYLVNGCWREGLSDPEIDPPLRDKLSAATDRLYRNRGDGTFEDVTATAGVNKIGYGMGVVTGDYDADGDIDIYVTNYGPNFLYRNNGDGTFTDVAGDLGVDLPNFSIAALFVDYDRDSRLDLYVGGYVDYDPDYKYYYAPDGFPGPLSYAGQQDRLFRGNTDGSFTDVTDDVGIVIEPVGRAMGIGAFDYNNDGFIDVFVSNDAMENFLFHNQGNGTFENRALEAGVAFGEAGDATAAMAAEIADIDGDGFFDLAVPDMKYSCLYHNTGQGFFNDQSAASGIAASCGQYVSWGSVFADFDLDGHLDLYISNGDAHHLEGHEDLLFRGNGKGGFEDISENAGDWAQQKFVSRGVAGGDYDNDGDIDLLVASLNDRPVLLRNDSPRNGRHWLSVRLVGRPANVHAIGAVVKASVNGHTMTRQRMSGGSYLSQHDPRIHFGLGKHKKVDVLEITWPDGSQQVVKDISADVMITIRQEGGTNSTTEP